MILSTWDVGYTRLIWHQIDEWDTLPTAYSKGWFHRTGAPFWGMREDGRVYCNRQLIGSLK